NGAAGFRQAQIRLLVFDFEPLKFNRHVEYDGATFCMCAIERAGQVFGYGVWTAQRLEARAGRCNQLSLVNVLGVFAIGHRSITSQQYHGCTGLGAFYEGGDDVRKPWSM